MKFRIKSEFFECDIITKDKSGNDVLVNKNNFNDYFANLMFLAGQSHLIEQNPHHNIDFEEINIEKDNTASEFIMNQGHRTVPQIYLNGELFVDGGWEGLSNMGLDTIRQRVNPGNLGTL